MKQLLIASLFALASLCAGIPIPNTPDGFVVGSDSAPVVFELFGDTMCPETAYSYPIVRQVMDSYGPQKIKFVFHALALPYTHSSMLTNQGLWVVSTRNISNAFPYIEAIFAAQGGLFNHKTLNMTTNEVIAAIGKVAVDAKTIPSVDEFVAGMASDDVYWDIVGSWKYIVSRAVTDTPTFFVNNVRVDGDYTWTVDDWKTVLDPLFKSSTQQPESCPSGQSECEYAPHKSMCCLTGEACVPNVGCRCLDSSLCGVERNCSHGQFECDYSPGKSMCCITGEACIPNVGCRCLDASKCDASSTCTPRSTPPAIHVAVSNPKASCKAHFTPCPVADGKVECCPSSEHCVPNVGCRCLPGKRCHKRAPLLFVAHDETRQCPSGLKECDYLPGKYQCCMPGEACIPNLGCRC